MERHLDVAKKWPTFPLTALVLWSLISFVMPSMAGSLSPFEPAPVEAEESNLRGETWFAETATHSIQLTPLTTEMRLAYFERVTGHPTDPFAAPEGQPEYLSFLLRIENRGDSELIYNPLRSWLVTSGRQVEAPVGASDLKFDFRSTGREFPVAYQEAAELLFDNVRTMAPGDSVHGLLLYPAIAPRVKQFKIDINVEIAGVGESELVAAYQRVKPKKRNKTRGTGTPETE
ncbi:MAG: hypothetical protein OES25_04695 [Acidobacteriota bacterium]|nr:hypothetical protein [Acidobacteriota bacterium]